jgi:uncharacterized tellurite resistance protein B-like protein
MNIASLSSVLKALQGGEGKAAAGEQLFKEVLLMTLARASSTDANIDPVEVDTVRKLIKQIIGENVSAADVRVAANSELYETTPLEKALTRVRNKLDAKHRAAIVTSLAKVIKSDTDVSAREVAFFDMVARALDASPAELAGLIGPASG